MAPSVVRRRRSAFAAGLATMAMALGFTTVPAQAVPPPTVDYVALGDSYTAGTGAGPVNRPRGDDCWQSHPGYVDVISRTNRVDLVANAACHGALLVQPSPGTTSVAEQLQGLVAAGQLSAETDLVTITAGANDLGFSSVLGACSVSSEACALALSQLNTADLEALHTTLVQTYVAIQSIAPNATIVVFGYPFIFDPSSEFAPLHPADQLKINQATLTLNRTIESAVLTATYLGVHAVYVDVTERFAGHAVNSSDPWLVLNLRDPHADYTFHPNKAGHSLGYAAALLAVTAQSQLIPQ